MPSISHRKLELVQSEAVVEVGKLDCRVTFSECRHFSRQNLEAILGKPEVDRLWVQMTPSARKTVMVFEANSQDADSDEIDD